jgi:GxxExxY protein
MLTKHADLTELIVNAFYAVYKTLGYGFLEKVYVKALVIELERRGLAVATAGQIPVYYGGQLIGEYIADIVVAGKVILEVKVVRTLAPEHEAQLLNYLKATPIEVGLLLNFGPRSEVRRKVYDNENKGSLKWTTASTE